MTNALGSSEREREIPARKAVSYRMAAPGPGVCYGTTMMLGWYGDREQPKDWPEDEAFTK